MSNKKDTLVSRIKESVSGILPKSARSAIRRCHYSLKKPEANKAYQQYYRNKNGNEKLSKEMFRDMVKWRMEKDIQFSEYFLFGFPGKDEEKRLEFIGDLNRFKILQNFNLLKNDEIFIDKFRTYETFQKYYHREIIKITSPDQYGVFQDFCKKHREIVIKIVGACRGDGVRLIRVEEGQEKKLFDQLLKDYGGEFVVEERIVQKGIMGDVHPESVNTVRITTIRMDDRTIIFHPFARFGRGKNIIDNAGGGGIICRIDVEKGTVFATGDESGKIYTVHPDTGTELIGFAIPHWEEAKALAKELAEVVPDNRYTGWDLAYTEDIGWVMVEGNAYAQYIGFQITEQKGFRSEIEGYIEELKSKK